MTRLFLFLCCFATLFQYGVGMCSLSPDETTWAVLSRTSPTLNDKFGYGMCMSDNVLVVTAYSSTVGAYLYVPTSLGVWEEHQYLHEGGSSFGHKCDVENQYNTIVVGERLGGPGGTAHVFQESVVGAQDWTLSASLVGNDPTDEFLGTTPSVYGHIIVLGSQNAEIAPTTLNGGLVYVYQEQSGPGAKDWVIQSKLVPADNKNMDFFGTTTDLYETTMIVGAILDDTPEGYQGTVYFYSEASPGVWIEGVEVGSTSSSNYYGSAVSVFGSVAAVSEKTGKLHILEETTAGEGDWAEVTSFSMQIELAVNVGVAGIVAGNTASTKAEFFARNDNGEWISRNVIDVDILGDGIGDIHCVQTQQSGTTIACADVAGTDQFGSVIIGLLECDDDCPGHICEHSTCVDSYMSYYCDCPKAYDGEFCTNCLCENGGVCHDDPITGIGYCDCTFTHGFGETCSKFCNNGYADNEWKACNCTLSGATGKFCTSDIDDCLSSPCANGGTCSDFGADLFPNHNNEFNCSCGSDSPYMGLTCEDTLCYSSPCLNGGTCVNGQDFVCNCTAIGGYEGEFCQTEIDECASSPCLNDGTCTDLLGDFVCDCAGTGYDGLTCAMDIDDCASSPCHNDGTCQDKGANKFKCICNEFYEGSTCTDNVDDCILKGYYCENGAVCSDDPVNVGDVMCDCSTSEGGFTGKYCNVPIEDACVTFNPCANGGKCILDDISKEMSCDCTDTGYEGDVCDVQVYVSECVSSPCLHEGQCYDPSDYQDDWYCVCVNGYFGDLCDFRACDSNPCQNGGTCTNDDDVYTCSCLENYSGAQCQIDEDQQAQVDSSSSSSVPPSDANGDESRTNQAQQEKNDSTLVIIISVVAVVVIAGAVGGVWYFKKMKTGKDQYVMPT